MSKPGYRLLALALAVLYLTSASTHGRRPNVILVVIDTLRRDHLGVYGYGRETAPFLHQLADGGATFDGISPSSWTKPATASLLTGLHPVRHQAVGRLDRLPAEAVTLAELLRNNGYHTVAASANGWVTPKFGFDQGFDRFIVCDSCAARELDAMLANEPSLASRSPLFLYVHFVDPHAPYEPHVSWDGRHLNAEEQQRSRVAWRDLAATQFLARAPSLLLRIRDAYDGEIRGVDEELESVVAMLARRGLMRNALLVITADHGEEMGEHGRMSHGQTLYDEVIRIPLVLRGPGIPAGKRLGLASLMDVVPTLLDWLDIDAPRGSAIDGQSLVSRLRSGRRIEDHRPFLLHLDFADGVAIALQQDRLTLVLGRDPYRKQLFDTEVDPYEQHDLLGDAANAALSTDLAQSLAEMYNAYAREALPVALASLDSHDDAKLRALGYVGGIGRVPPMRRIPKRLQPAGPNAAGLLGWEPTVPSAACLPLSSVGTASRVLDGWWNIEPTGRWTKTRATLAIAHGTSDGLWSWRVTGLNSRPDAPLAVLRADGQEFARQLVPPGPFAITAVVRELPVRSPFVLQIEVTPTYRPANDNRDLGLEFSEVCLQPASGATAAE